MRQAFIMVLQLIAISAFVAGCAPMMPRAQAPLIAPRDVPAPIPVKCMDKRDAKSMLPDLSGIPPDDYEAIGRAGRATIDLLKADLLAADKQITACTGE